MPIDFPNSPTTGQVYTYLGKSWVYNGTGWDAPKALSEIGAVRTFANATARTAAIPTPTEGIVTYLNDIDILQTHNGSSWVPAAGLNHIRTQSFTDISTLTVDNVFTSLYRGYQILFYVTAVSGTGRQLNFSLRQGSTTLETNYRNQRIFNFGSTVVSDTLDGATNRTNIFPAIDSTNIGGAFAFMYVANPFLTMPTTTTVTATSGFGASSQIDQRVSMVHNASVSVTGFQLTTNTGTVTGSFDVYGVK
jgi:hypothetical protein